MDFRLLLEGSKIEDSYLFDVHGRLYILYGLRSKAKLMSSGVVPDKGV